MGGGISAYGQYEEGQAAGDAASQNARFARLAARDALARGSAEAGQARMAGSEVASAQTVAQAAAGVDPSVGSAAELSAQSKAMAELDADALQVNAAREAWGLRVQANNLDAQGRQAKKAAKYGVAGSILGGISGAASAFGRFGKG